MLAAAPQPPGTSTPNPRQATNSKVPRATTSSAPAVGCVMNKQQPGQRLALSLSQAASAAFVAVTALVGYLWLIPKYSYFGAAWVTVYSELMIVAIAAWIIYKTTKALPSWVGLLRITGAVLIMGIGVYYMQAWPLLLVIPLSATLYIGALLLVKGVTVVELKTTLWKEKTS